MKKINTQFSHARLCCWCSWRIFSHVGSRSYATHCGIRMFSNKKKYALRNERQKCTNLHWHLIIMLTQSVNWTHTRVNCHRLRNLVTQCWYTHAVWPHGRFLPGTYLDSLAYQTRSYSNMTHRLIEGEWMLLSSKRKE